MNESNLDLWEMRELHFAEGNFRKDAVAGVTPPPMKTVYDDADSSESELANAVKGSAYN
ncbi:hypothetical protein [Erwinia typographi]|uniref:hypothetical protein n=1 Tax=Erwinia typographi TaxID=371042 RepID=UPI0012EE6DE5|nr:hypothetical protein [Erwinia typographi]